MSEVEALLRDLCMQMRSVQEELSEKATLAQLDATRGILQSQLDQKAVLADQMDDKLLALRFEQLDNRVSGLEKELPPKAEINQIEQDIQSLQQVLSLEKLSDVRLCVTQLEASQRACLSELDAVKKAVTQELGKKTADVMCCLEDGLQGLRREMIHTGSGCCLSPRLNSHSHHYSLPPVTTSVGAQAVEHEIRASDAYSTSFAQVDLSLRLLQNDLSQKESRRL